MTPPTLLLLGPAPAQGLTELESAYRVLTADIRQEVLGADLAAGIHAIALMTNRRVDADYLRPFTSLKLVASFGVGYDHIDAEWAARHGILVTNTPDVLNEEVADTALGLLICTVRELPQAMAHLRAGRWPEGPYRLTPSTLRNRTVGLVGMGRIGQCIARRLDAFAVLVVYHARHPYPEVSYRYYPDLVAMAQEVDTLLVIVPGGPRTRHLIDRTVLDALGPRGILINIARGSVVDEQALIEALAGQRILAAGLDVYEHEPAVPDELLRMPNVVLLPHVGSASRYTRDRMQQLVVENLMAWAAGRRLPTPVAESAAIVTPAGRVT